MYNGVRLCAPPSWLTVDWLLAAFSGHRSEAMRRYMDFVADGKNQPGPWEKLKNQIFLGSDQFITSLQRGLNVDASHREIPVVQRRPPPKPLAEIVEAHGRDDAIFEAYASGGYGLKEIWRLFWTALFPRESNCEAATISKEQDLTLMSVRDPDVSANNAGHKEKPWDFLVR